MAPAWPGVVLVTSYYTVLYCTIWVYSTWASASQHMWWPAPADTRASWPATRRLCAASAYTHAVCPAYREASGYPCTRGSPSSSRLGRTVHLPEAVRQGTGIFPWIILVYQLTIWSKVNVLTPVFSNFPCKKLNLIKLDSIWPNMGRKLVFTAIQLIQSAFSQQF